MDGLEFSRARTRVFVLQVLVQPVLCIVGDISSSRYQDLKIASTKRVVSQCSGYD